MGRVPIGCVRYDDLRATLVLGGGGLTCDGECAVNEDIAYSENAPKTFWIDEAIASDRTWGGSIPIGLSIAGGAG